MDTTTASISSQVLEGGTTFPSWMTDHKVIKDEFNRNDADFSMAEPNGDQSPPEMKETDTPEVNYNLLPPFRPTMNLEDGCNSISYHNICIMPEYATISLEELRWNDHQNNLPPKQPRGLFVPESGIKFLKRKKTFGDTQYVDTPPTYGKRPKGHYEIREIGAENILDKIPTPTTPPEVIGDNATLMEVIKGIPTREVPLQNDILQRCGIILSNPKTYTRPNSRTLDLLTKDGKCIVRNFMIGHREIGTCTFPGKMDVYGVNLDEIFEFSKSEGVTIYKNRPVPVFGQGFHRPAVIALKIRPNPKMDLSSFVQLLQYHCIKHEPFWEFVKYEEEIGIWTFRVQLCWNESLKSQ